MIRSIYYLFTLLCDIKGYLQLVVLIRLSVYEGNMSMSPQREKCEDASSSRDQSILNWGIESTLTCKLSLSL